MWVYFSVRWLIASFSISSFHLLDPGIFREKTRYYLVTNIIRVHGVVNATFLSNSKNNKVPGMFLRFYECSCDRFFCVPRTVPRVLGMLLRSRLALYTKDRSPGSRNVLANAPRFLCVSINLHTQLGVDTWGETRDIPTTDREHPLHPFLPYVMCPFMLLIRMCVRSSSCWHLSRG